MQEVYHKYLTRQYYFLSFGSKIFHADIRLRKNQIIQTRFRRGGHVYRTLIRYIPPGQHILYCVDHIDQGSVDQEYPDRYRSETLAQNVPPLLWDGPWAQYFVTG